ncbi:flagellin N-terminal helical domain-containing protein [Brevibacillus borstelensis]|jgi:flagellin|uniref:flagellin N-terminal helical domain-containing protein n=1 Tax=Brevibacillus borstelensis TaxID=45462 RepID=UPI002E1F8884|nr:flagellin [Brevibacillus borstelensis]MED1745796.1 flagellin [Brevibacillus borstelensis]
MIINHNISAMNTHRQLGVNTGSLAKNVEKLSSGYRINRAADDAAGLSISERMRAQIRGMEQASRNSQDGISLIQTAEGALQTVNNMLVRIKEIATQSANGTYGNDADRARLQEELAELNKEITNIQDNTKFNGIDLLNSTGSGKISFQIGEGSTQTLDLDLSKFSLKGSGGVSATVASWSIATQSGARSVLAGIEDVINKVSAARSYLGANQNRLENTINNLNITSENLTAAESRIRDVDMAKEQMQFTKNNILTQASQAMLAQANQLPQGVLQLLR